MRTTCTVKSPTNVFLAKFVRKIHIKVENLPKKCFFFPLFVDYSPIYGTDMETLWTDAEKTLIHVMYWEVKSKMALAFLVFLVFFLSIMSMKNGWKIILKREKTKEKCKLGKKYWRNECFCGNNCGAGPHGLSHTPWYEHLWTPRMKEK